MLCSSHSSATGEAATRGGFTRRLASRATPTASNSLMPRGKSVAVALICSKSGSGREVDHEGAGVLDIAQRVLAADRGELHDGRGHAGDREEGVRGEVVRAVGRCGGDPGDGPGDDHGGEQPVEGVAVALGGVVVDAHGGSMAGRARRVRERPSVRLDAELAQIDRLLTKSG